VMILIKTPERSRYLQFTEPVMTVRGLIWSVAGQNQGAIHFSHLEDLKPYRIGVTLGYSYGPEFDALLKTMTAEPAASDYLNYKKLLAQRIDIFPANEIVARGLFKKHPELQGKFHHSDRSFIQWVLRMGIGKKSALVPLIPQINQELARLEATGFIRDTVARFTE